MNKVSGFMVIAMFLGALWQPSAGAQTRERSQVAEEYIWQLEDIYPSDKAWEQAKEGLTGRFDEITQYDNKLADSAEMLLACLQLNSDISKTFARLHSYAHMKSDENTRNSKYLAMQQEIQQLGPEYNAKAAFIAPEIAAMDRSKIDEFIEAEPGLNDYRMFLYDIQRTKKHLLSEEEEQILAQSGLIAGGAYSIYSVFSNADFPYPEIELSDGTQVVLTKAGYSQHRASANRADREAVFQAFFGALDKYRATFGTQLYAQVNKDLFYSRARNYESSLRRALDGDNIPTEVYSVLIENVHKNLDSFHRYLKLKERMLGVDQLKYSDVYAPVVEGVDLQYNFEQAKELVYDAVKPLGSDYRRVVGEAFENRWIDVYPTPGKRAGAYCNGSAYDVHPYMLLNYNGRYDDVSTLAHELGHAMHSYYSNKNQPYPMADYATFVAEVASTLNEALLIDKMLKEIKDDSIRMSLLMSYLDGVKGTVFRQTQFAEFEWRIHEKAEQGEALTGDVLTQLYGDILKAYYGHEQGVCEIDDLYAIEWAYVPHFYYNFYVFQYSTSFMASTALSERILADEPGIVDRYIEFLSAGGSDYPIEILKEAGVDMTTAEPFEKTMAAMNRAIDEIEAILDKRGK